jgi:hypothetical protein
MRERERKERMKTERREEEEGQNGKRQKWEIERKMLIFLEL